MDTAWGKIYVLAGVNGAGKSSVLGAMLREIEGGEFWNPDEVAKELREDDPSLTLEQAQSIAWDEGVAYLRRAIEVGAAIAFETTLGGRTITRILAEAVRAGRELNIWYVGLDSVDRHIERVKARVAAGGHDIPEQRIRERYQTSHINLATLALLATELRVYDNSAPGNPEHEDRPEPRLLLHVREGGVVMSVPRDQAPPWCEAVFDVVGA